MRERFNTDLGFGNDQKETSISGFIDGLGGRSTRYHHMVRRGGIVGRVLDSVWTHKIVPDDYVLQGGEAVVEGTSVDEGFKFKSEEVDYITPNGPFIVKYTEHFHDPLTEVLEFFLPYPVKVYTSEEATYPGERLTYPFYFHPKK